MDTEQLLDLTTQTIQRDHVKIDGESYEVMSIDELNLAETLSFARKGAKLAQLGQLNSAESAKALADISEDEFTDLISTVEKLADRILLAPDEVKAKLTDMQKLRLVGAVFSHPVMLGTPANTTSSPDSKGSTEETRKAG